MWGSPYDHSRLAPHGPPHGPPHGLPHGPPHRRGYEPPQPQAPPHPHYPPPRDITFNQADPYQHRPLYRPPPPPPPPRYDYGYHGPPSYTHPYQPPHPARPYYNGEASAPPEDMTSSLPVIGGGCTCKKSKCLKLYCQCFSSSTTCGPKCKCQACHNTTLHRDDIDEARQVILERNPAAFELKVYPTAPPPESPTKSGCKCRRSFCLKKYCECFNHGSKCGHSCRCVSCRNQPDSANDRPRAGPYAQAQTKSLPRIPSESSYEKEPGADRMAIFAAAMAMTELLGRKRSSSSDECQPETKRLKEGDESFEDRAIVSSSSCSNSSSPEPHRPSPLASPVSVPHFNNRCYPYSTAASTTTSNNNSPPSYRTTDELPRLSGLPKSLSFRKICSRCGKTRGEHGELGFGHRCVYQECGKCGAGVQMHGAGPMGILCTLSEQEGATPGAARAYERKIMDLAVRAELQQKLQQERVMKSTNNTNRSVVDVAV